MEEKTDRVCENMKYIDRKGNLTFEEQEHDKFLRHLYNDWGGKLCLKLLVRPWAARLAGVFLNSPLSAAFVPGFAKRHKIDLSEYEETVYRSYNDFFTRKIKAQERPIASNARALISPCDGKASVYRIGHDSRFFIKNTEYTVEQLLRNKKLAERYVGGYAVVLRLSIDNCHRYCYVAEGVKSATVHLAGKCHTAHPVANDFFPVYAENTREYTLLQTTRFGTMVVMEVGAMLVGKITNHHKGPRKVEKGEEKGYFEFGGSTIVLLIQPGGVRLDYDLWENTENGFETFVKMGERIGEQKLPKRTGKVNS